jgi:hypothetical protein
VVNAPASPAADLFDVNLNGTTKFRVLQGGATQCDGGCRSTTFQSTASTNAVTIESGISGTAGTTPQGALTVRGGSWTGGPGAGSTAGSATMQGGDNASTANNFTTSAGNLTLRPGQVTANGASATAVNGNLIIAATAIKDSGIYNIGDLACFTSSGKVASCTSTPTTEAWVGILLAANGNSATYQVLGDTTVSSQNPASFGAGDYVCIDPLNPGKVIDNLTNRCSPQNTGVGVVKKSDTNVTSHSIVIARY